MILLVDSEGLIWAFAVGICRKTRFRMGRSILYGRNVIVKQIQWICYTSNTFATRESAFVTSSLLFCKPSPSPTPSPVHPPPPPPPPHPHTQCSIPEKRKKNVKFKRKKCSQERKLFFLGEIKQL